MTTNVAVTDRILDALRQLFGDRVSTSGAVRAHHGKDVSYHAGHDPDAVVFPHTIDEVVEIVKVCARHGVPVVPYGTGTSLEGHIAALHGGVCIDLGQMDKILRVDAEDMDVTVEAGVTRKQLNRHLHDSGLFFPIDPGADASLGGMAATRASGTNAVRYGTMRENVLALTVVLADGRVIRTARRARKSAAGYDLTRLFVGWEGTLGVITEVTLRLYGVPEAVSVAVSAFPTIDDAVNTVILTIQSGVPVARIELLDELTVAAVNAYSGLDNAVAPTLFFEFHGTEAGVAEQTETVQAIAADVCVPISRLAECIAETRKDLEASSVVAPLVGHVGDGNFHLIYLIDPDDAVEVAEAKRLNERMVMRALAMDGTCTGEHGIGYGKLDFLLAEHGEAVSVMRLLKQALDPDNIMNPGKVIRV